MTKTFVRGTSSLIAGRAIDCMSGRDRAFPAAAARIWNSLPNREPRHSCAFDGCQLIPTPQMPLFSISFPTFIVLVTYLLIYCSLSIKAYVAYLQSKFPVVSQLLYASPAWWGYLKADERNWLQSIIAKAVRYGYLPRSFSTLDELREDSDEKLFFSARYNPFHVLHRLLLPIQKCQL